MSPPIIRSAVFLFVMVSACLARAEEPPILPDGDGPPYILSYQCDPWYEGDPEVAIPTWLRPDELPFVAAEDGQELPLNTIIAMPASSANEDALLIIEFAREDLNQAFVQAHFFDRQALIPVVHPYAQVGIEYLLTEERLILKIHPDIVFHLRDDAAGLYLGQPGTAEYQRRMFTSGYVRDIFRSDDVVGRVILVSGKVYVSDNPEFVRSELPDVYTEFRGRSFGVVEHNCTQVPSTKPSAPPRPWFPQSYPPRVLPGR